MVLGFGVLFWGAFFAQGGRVPPNCSEITLTSQEP